MNIKEIQPEIYKRFEVILQKNRLSHAYLFSGGFGSLEVAIWLSQALFCEKKENGLPCGTCRNCRLIKDRDFADLHIIEPDGQSIKKEQIKNLQETFSQTGFESDTQVIIIDGADKMNPSATNALLKSIEEPEGNIYIFLITENENLVLDTIKSRSQIIAFPRQETYLKEYLIQEGVLPKLAAFVAKVAKNPQDASELALDTWFDEALKLLKKFSDLLMENQVEAFLFIPTVLERFKDKKQEEMAFNILQIYLSDFLPQNPAASLLDTSFEAYRMWKSNVKFQSCLEYIILDEMVNI
ncbi:DNA polymerase III subunit delta' [Streptococcaceae bacterium ESL0687]|nr:DNA polymerase III subunit delta' [Streptococcaceae bacterium ESL0687]